MPVQRSIPRVCRQCGSDFLATVSAVNSGKGLLCSVACRFAAQDRTSHAFVPRKSRKVQIPCHECGVPVSRMPSNIHGRAYCSKTCRYTSARPHAIRQPIIQSDGLTALVPLMKHDDSVRTHAVIDATDAAWVGQWRWHRDDDGYAVREVRTDDGRQRILLHRELLGLSASDELEGDHVNRDRLDDRRSNLRAIPTLGNRQNMPGQFGTSSVYRGVSWNRQTGKWDARVQTKGKNHRLGSFTDEHAAAEAARAGRARLLPYAVD